MIDSGASRWFMYLEFTYQYQIPTQSKKNTALGEAIDGCQLKSGVVTHKVIPKGLGHELVVSAQPSHCLSP